MTATSLLLLLALRPAVGAGRGRGAELATVLAGRWATPDAWRMAGAKVRGREVASSRQWACQPRLTGGGGGRSAWRAFSGACGALDAWLAQNGAALQESFHTLLHVGACLEACGERGRACAALA